MRSAARNLGSILQSRPGNAPRFRLPCSYGSAHLRAYGHSLLARQVAPASWGRRTVALREFYECLTRREGHAVSIAHDLEIPQRPKHVHRWWTDAQVRQFRRAFRDGQSARLLSGKSRPADAPDRHKGDPRIAVLRDRAITELGLMGLRLAEVTALDVGDLIELHRLGRAAIVVHRKGGKDQVLPLVPDAQRALRRWVRARPAVPTPALFFRLPFQPRRRMRLHNVSVAEMIHAYAQRAGRSLPPRKAFHHLRHSAGQRMADMGVGIEEAQVFLGPESPETTQIYYSVSDVRHRRVARRLRH